MLLTAVALFLFTRDNLPLETSSLTILILLVAGFQIFPYEKDGVSLGAVEFFGQKPCQRCVVPSRSPESGEVIPRFTQIFCERREATLPDFAPRERFDHFYRLAINTSLASAGELSRLAVGDAVRVLS